MHKVILYSVLLVAGLILAQFVDLHGVRSVLSTVSAICFCYIMMEAGLEFTIDKRHLRSYVKDCFVAFTAATFPWLLCALYFVFATPISVSDALLVARFAAPTSTGVLFAMLAGAGLGMTWLFRKARILAIFDDLDTVLLMIPLQILIMKWSLELLIVIPVLIALLFAAYFFLHRLHWPTAPRMLLVYASLLTFLVEAVYRSTDVSLEILVPAFVFGSILFNPHNPLKSHLHRHEHAYIEPERGQARLFDMVIKCTFMFLVGIMLPPLEWAGFGIWLAMGHVVALTLLSNIGKCFPSFCYRDEATLRERVALSVAMFPRGEVGAGKLLLSLQFGLSKEAISLASLSLALNLLLTGVFVAIIVRLVRPVYSS